MTDSRSTPLHHDLETVVRKLLSYCEANEWAGYDPYDALNSRVFAALPFLNARIPRLVLTQVLKRSPINIRPLLGIPKTQNPKAIALFLAAFLKLSRYGMPGQEERAALMIKRLGALRSQGVPYWCWGYSFPWQTRTLLVPAGAPNLISTCFAAAALLDAHEQGYDVRCLNMAVSAAEYLVNELYWAEGTAAGFSYPIGSLRTQCHNANFLAAGLLCRVWRHTRRKEFIEAALNVARYSAGKQRADGSWPYGEEPTQQWVDNFHTGYNLCALDSISKSTGSTEFDACILQGFDFYRRHFFREDAAARYFHNRTYPIDIHCVAQSIITLHAFRHLKPDNDALARSLLQWALKHMWDQKGFFYYRVIRSGTIRIPYMRWSQAWMLEALATLLSESGGGLLEPSFCESRASAKGKS